MERKEEEKRKEEGSMNRNNEDDPKKKNRKIGIFNSYRFFFRTLRLYCGICREAFYSQILGKLFHKIVPYVTIWLTALLVEELASARRFGVLMFYASMILASEAVLKFVGTTLNAWKNYAYDLLLAKKPELFMEKRLALDYVDIDSQSTYDLLSRIEQNENFIGFGMFLSFLQFNNFLSAIFQIAGGAVLSFGLFTSPIPDSGGFAVLNHPLVILLVIAVMLLFAMLSPYFFVKAESYWKNYNEEGTMGNRYFKFYGYMGLRPKRAPDIRMYEQQEICSHYMGKEGAFGIHSKIAQYAKGPMGWYMCLSEAMSVALLGVIFSYTCLKAYAGAFGIGEVTQYIGATSALFLGVQEFSQTFVHVCFNGEFAALAFRFLDIPNKMYRGDLTTEKNADSNYDIEFRNVSFKYPGTETYALKNVSLKFRFGGRLAVVGMNGSGKTTLIKLLCRLYDPDEGEILLNGINIQEYDYKEYMEIFSVVFQDFAIFSFPLGENVARKQDYDAESVWKIMENIGFSERLAELPNGLKTYVGKTLDEEGVDFSGGESQKIAIARALYKDSPIMILDEPTAALDPIAEAEIYEKFDRISENRTTVYISHRLSSCKFCDEIAVFHAGEMIQKGSHDALLSDKQGKYYELWNAQARYYTDQKESASVL